MRARLLQQQLLHMCPISTNLLFYISCHCQAGAEDEAEQAAQQLLLTPGMSMNLLMADPFQLPLAVMPGV